MKKVPYTKYEIIVVDLSGYLGYGNPLYPGLDITTKRRAKGEESQQREQHAIDQLFKGGSITELIVPPDERAKGLYLTYYVQRTSDGHYFTTLSPVPCELEEYLVKPS